MDIFGDEEREEKEESVAKAVIEIKREFGKNALMKALSYKEKATGIARNCMVGGHNAG